MPKIFDDYRFKQSLDNPDSSLWHRNDVFSKGYFYVLKTSICEHFGVGVRDDEKIIKFLCLNDLFTDIDINQIWLILDLTETPNIAHFVFKEKGNRIFYTLTSKFYGNSFKAVFSCIEGNYCDPVVSSSRVSPCFPWLCMKRR